jgi:hypothetical protein
MYEFWGTLPVPQRSKPVLAANKTILKSTVLHEQSEKDEIREFAKSLSAVRQ